MFVYEFGRGCNCVVFESFSFDSFGVVVGCDDDILITGSSHDWFEGSQKIKFPLLEGFERKNWLVRLLGLFHWLVHSLA